MIQKGPIHDTKKPYMCHKWALYTTQKSPIHDAKESYMCHKGALYTTQNSPIIDTEEKCMRHKRALYMPPKSPIHDTKETYVCHKRALYMAQARCVPSFVSCTGLFCVMYRALLCLGVSPLKRCVSATRIPLQYSLYDWYTSLVCRWHTFLLQKSPI